MRINKVRAAGMVSCVFINLNINIMTKEELLRDYISYHYVEGNINNEQRVKMEFAAATYLQKIEQLTIPDAVKSLKGVDKIPLIEWREKTFRKIGTNRFELRTNTALVYGMDEISKMYDSF